jgi:endoribonuclease Dicer
LEFLGDAVLDILLTQHLFLSHKDTDEGELTDLRSASVNNENFAQVAVRHNLHHFLQHSSGLLQDQITEYVNSLEGSSMDRSSLLSSGSSRGPKVCFQSLSVRLLRIVYNELIKFLTTSMSCAFI